MKNTFLLLSFGWLFLTACSNYNQIVKADDFAAKYELANKLYDQKQYEKAIVLYEQIYQHAPKSAEGELSYYRLAKSYFQIEDYYMAQYYYSAYMQRFPYSVKNEEVLFMVALCSVKNSPEYSLDQTETELAINNVQQFIDRYPQSYLLDSCNKIIDQLEFKLETKSYSQVKLYDKMQSYRAAVAAGELFLEGHGQSDYAEEVNYLIVKNSYFLTVNSIESKKTERIDQTNERFRTFALRYPDSKYTNELNAFIEKLSEKTTEK
ncbi:MAG: outer membrane protein assembly factor BamD [Flavobacteriales bacterium]